MENPIVVSDAAFRRIAAILRSKEAEKALRISVEGGGCSGFSYKYDLSTSIEDDDLVLEKDGARVVIDPVSVPYLAGSVIDFVDDLMGQSFQVRNPNAVAACGCGTSFSI